MIKHLLGSKDQMHMQTMNDGRAAVRDKASDGVDTGPSTPSGAEFTASTVKRAENSPLTDGSLAPSNSPI